MNKGNTSFETAKALLDPISFLSISRFHLVHISGRPNIKYRDQV